MTEIRGGYDVLRWLGAKLFCESIVFDSFLELGPAVR